MKQKFILLLTVLIMSVGNVAKAQEWEEYYKNYFSWGDLVFTPNRDDFQISLRKTFMIGSLVNKFTDPKDYSHVQQYYGIYRDRKAMITVHYTAYSWRPAYVLVSMEYGKGKQAKAQVMRDYKELRKRLSGARDFSDYTGFEYYNYDRKGKIEVNPGTGETGNEHLLHMTFYDMKNMKYLKRESQRQQLLGN